VQLEQFGFTHMCVWRGQDEPCRLERGEDAVEQGGDVADRSGGDGFLGTPRDF
jgi:hypothetical protein